MFLLIPYCMRPCPGPAWVVAIASLDFYASGVPRPCHHRRTELAKQGSALYHVSKGDAPFLILQGDRDPSVPLDQSQGAG